MSLYINHENQRILWESIQQHPSIELIPKHDRNDWFKNIVKNVYETIPKPWFHRKITTEELNLLNQSTVRRMLGDLKPPMVSLPNQYQQPVNNMERYGNHMSYNEESMDVGIKSAHTPMIQQRYLEKQQELESMLRQPNPATTVDFKMSTLDEPITNMEELLQKHAREREQDLALDPRVTPIIPLNSSGDLRSPSELVVQRLLGTEALLPDAPATFPVSSTNNIKINITEEPVTISIIDLVSDQSPPQAKLASDLVVVGILPTDQTSPVITPFLINNADLSAINELKGNVTFGIENAERCKKASALKKHISFQDEVPLPNSSGSEACFGLSSSVRSAPCPNSSGLCSNKATFRVSSEGGFEETDQPPLSEFTYQIPENVLLEQKVLKLEQEMVVLKRLIFGVYKGMSVCPMQTLLLETMDGGNS
jgi:hypothetical protein